MTYKNTHSNGNGSNGKSRIEYMLESPHFRRIFGESLGDEQTQRFLKIFESETYYMRKFLEKAEEFLKDRSVMLRLRPEPTIKETLLRRLREAGEEVEALQGMTYRIEEVKEEAEERRLQWLLFDQEAPWVEPTRKGEKSVRILDRSREEGWLYLEREVEPDPNTGVVEVKITPNTYPIRKQLEALDWLRRRPLPEHLPIIQLFNRPEASYWKELTGSFLSGSEPEPDWRVLSDASRDGTKEQREFVRRVLKKAPFSLLEGPPGTGKTTTILEIIYQLIQREEKVLMVSSTHAAVDNVLERLAERYKDLLQEIAPLRVGRDVSQIKENVQEFLLHRQVEKQLRELKRFYAQQRQLTPAQELMRQALQDESRNHQWVESLLLESANLIVGTMIGVLQYPELKKGEERIIFDSVIIDEASKTTFLEFLVPALYGKRWILVGDVKQLPPYIENEYVAEFLERDKSIPQLEVESIARCFYPLRYLRSAEAGRSHEEFSTPIILTPLSQMKADVERLQRVGQLEDEEIVEVRAEQLRQPEQARRLELLIHGAAAIVAEHKPEVLRWLYRHMRAKAHYYFPQWMNGQKDSPLQDRVQRFWCEKPHTSAPMAEEIESWGQLLADRLTQRFSFRRANPELYEHANKDIQLLTEGLPEEAGRHIRAIERLVFPSILEMLQEGVPKLKEKHVSTVLSEGLPQKYKNEFFIMLKYQHRMHAEIAELPSRHFYGGESLLTPAYINGREWKWRSQEPRVSWVPIKAVNPKRPIHNPEEVDKIMRILREILDAGYEMEVAILSFYLDQVRMLRRELRKLTKSNNSSRFDYGKVRIYLYTVDKFQGQEADAVLLSFVKFSPFAHYTSPNRLNVALTRARHKLILFGAKEELRHEAKLPALRELASLSHVIKL